MNLQLLQPSAHHTLNLLLYSKFFAAPFRAGSGSPLFSFARRVFVYEEQLACLFPEQNLIYQHKVLTTTLRLLRPFTIRILSLRTIFDFSLVEIIEGCRHCVTAKAATDTRAFQGHVRRKETVWQQNWLELSPRTRHTKDTVSCSS